MAALLAWGFDQIWQGEGELGRLFVCCKGILPNVLPHFNATLMVVTLDVREKTLGI